MVIDREQASADQLVCQNYAALVNEEKSKRATKHKSKSKRHATKGQQNATEEPIRPGQLGYLEGLK